MIRTFITRDGSVAVVVDREEVRKISASGEASNLGMIIRELRQKFNESGFTRIKQIDKPDKVILILEGSSGDDLGEIEVLVDLLEHRYRQMVFGTTMHAVTVFKSHSPFPESKIVAYRLRNGKEHATDRNVIYSLLNKASNAFYKEYGLLFVKVKGFKIATTESDVIELPEKISIVVDDKELEFEREAMELTQDSDRRQFIKEAVARTIRMKMVDGGYVIVGQNALIHGKRVFDIGKVSIYRGFLFDVLVFDDWYVGLSIRPINKIISNVSLFEYFDFDENRIKALKNVILGRTVYLDKLSDRGKVRDVVFTDDEEYDRVFNSILKDDERRGIPILKILRKSKEIYRFADEVRIAFTMRDVHIDPAFKLIFKELKKEPHEVLKQAKGYISEISPLKINDFEIEFSREPMEVFLDER